MPQEPLNIEEVNGTASGQRVLRLTGPVTLSNFFPFQAMVRADTSRALVLDLTGVPYIDSAGIGALVGAYVNRQKDGRSLALAGSSIATGTSGRSGFAWPPNGGSAREPPRRTSKRRAPQLLAG